MTMTPSSASAGAAAFAAWWLFDNVRKMFYLVTPWEMALTDEDEFPRYLVLVGPPMFTLFIVFEALLQWYKARATNKGSVPSSYSITDTFSNYIIGLTQQVSGGAVDFIALQLSVDTYQYVYDHYRLGTVDIKSWPVLSFVTIMLLKDLGYYWNHRNLHEFHLLWSTHSVHHSGEHYNNSAGLRQGVLQSFVSWPYSLPIALLGFSPQAFSAHAQLNTLYQYWVHTDLINRLPFGLEYIVNSPMAHRMHHRPPGNQNYAGVLIIWDRLFGTYRAETVRKDYYGLAKQPQTFNPFALNVNHFGTMAQIGKTSGKARPWWHILTNRRVRATTVCDPRLLLKPIPPMVEDKRADGPQRAKFVGNAADLTSLATTCGYILIFVVTLLEGVFCMQLQGKNDLHWADFAAATVQCLLLFYLISQISNGIAGKPVTLPLGAVGVASSTAAVILARPFASVLAPTATAILPDGAAAFAANSTLVA